MKRRKEEREKTGKAVLLYQGVSSIAPEAADDGQPSLSSALPRASSSSQEVATRFLSSILLADDYVMTVLLEGGGLLELVSLRLLLRRHDASLPWKRLRSPIMRGHC